MRFSPSGDLVAYTAGYGGGDLTIAIVDAATGGVITALPGGHDPRWIGPTSLVARSLDGSSNDAGASGYHCRYVGANDGDLDALNGRAAYAANRTAGVTVYAPTVVPRTFPSTFEPALSAGGTVILRDVATGWLRLERLAGCVDAPAKESSLGPGTRPRWSSGTLAFDSIPYGRAYARTTPDQPTVDLSIPGRSCTMPVPLWTGVALYVGLVVDDGQLVVAPWEELLQQTSDVWTVATSGGSAFDWDLAVVPGQPLALRVAYLSHGGVLVLSTIDLTQPLTSLDATPPEPGPEPPEPGPEPPEPGPEPPEPGPGPGPEPPIDPEEPMLPTVDMIPRDQTVMAADAIDEYLRANPRLGLAAGIWPSDFYGDGIGTAQRLDVVAAYVIGEWCPEVCRLGPFPGDAAGWDVRRNQGLDHTFHVIEAERGEQPAPGPTPEPGTVRGPIGTDRRWFTVPD